MAISTDPERVSECLTDSSVFDAQQLISRKPSSLPDIYAFIASQGPVSPGDIQQELNVSKSVTFASLKKLQETQLVERIKRGTYETAPISLSPRTVHWLGALRSEKQFRMCRYAVESDQFEVADLTAAFGGYRSSVRDTANRLHEEGFFNRTRVPFEKSPKAYQVTDKAREMLAAIRVDDYRGQNGRHVTPHTTGIEGTDFRTAYEIEDLNYLLQSATTWVQPVEIATRLGKNHKKTLQRFADLEDRGLVKSKALREKFVYEPTAKAGSLINDLRLYDLSLAHEIDLYGAARKLHGTESWSLNDLYSILLSERHDIRPKELDKLVRASKHANVIRGNSASGYRFVVDPIENDIC